MKKFVVFAVAAMILLPGLQVAAFDNEKDAKDFIAKNVNVITDFIRTKGNIAAIPQKIVVAGLNIRYVMVPYRGPKIGFGFAGNLMDAVVNGAMIDDMKKQAVSFPLLVTQSFQQNFKPAKITVLPLETLAASKTYQGLDTKTFSAEMRSQGVGLALPPVYEYYNYDLWRIPGPGLRFITGGDLPKKLFPVLRTEAGADGVAVVQIAILKMSNDEIKIGSCLIEIYAPAKSPNNPDVLAFSADVKNPGEASPLTAVKKDQWKVKEKDKEVAKPVEEFWPLIGKWLDNFFSSYGYIVDQSIK